MNNILCQSTLLPCQRIYTSGAMSDYTIEMSVCVELCRALVSATQKNHCGLVLWGVIAIIELALLSVW